MFVTLSELLSIRAQVRSKPMKPYHHSRVAGTKLSPYRGQGMHYAETRPYQPGDDARFMDWRVMARTGKPHTKIFQEETRHPLTLVVDDSPQMRFGTKVQFKSTLATKIAAYLAWHNLSLNQPLETFIIREKSLDFLPTKAGETQILTFFHQLLGTSTGQSLSDPWSTLSAYLHLRHQHRGRHILISDFSHPHRLPKPLHSKQNYLAIGLSDPSEHSLPRQIQAPLTDKIRRLDVGAISSQIAQSYQSAFLNQQAIISQHFATQNTRYHSFSTDQPLASVFSTLAMIV